MKFEDLKKVLELTGLEVGYHHWETGQVPQLPYILYLDSGSDNFRADNQVYYGIKNIRVELYSNLKNIREEKKLEKILNDHKLPFDNYESYIESEKMYLKAYEIQL